MLLKELIAQIRFEVDEASYQGAAKSLGVIKGLIKLVEQGAKIEFDTAGVNKAASALANLSRMRMMARMSGMTPEEMKRAERGQTQDAKPTVRSLESIHKVSVDNASMRKAEADLKRLGRPLLIRTTGGELIHHKIIKPLRNLEGREIRVRVGVDGKGNLRQALQQAKALSNVSQLIGSGRTATFNTEDAKGLGRTFEDWNSNLAMAPGWLALIRSRLGYLAAFAGVSFSFQKYIAMSDHWKTIEGQIKNVLKDESRLVEIEDKLYASAARTRQSYAETAGLFTSVTRSASELGKSTEEVLAFAEDVSNALLLGGGSKGSQQAALIQLGQALGSGVLRGDELNSIMEQAPKLAQTIAQGMGIGIGQLRQYGRDGKITAEQVFNAVRKQSDELKKGVDNIPWTVQQAMGRVSDAMGKAFFNIEKEFKLGDKLSRAISAVADMFDVLTRNTKLFAAGLRLAAVYAGILFAMAKRNTIVMTLQTLISLLGVTRVGFHGAAAAAGVFQAASIKAALASAGAFALPALKALLLVAALAALYVILEDLYYWINGGKKTLMGEMFGSWEKALDKVIVRIRTLFNDIKMFFNETFGFDFEIDETLPGAKRNPAKVVNPKNALAEAARIASNYNNSTVYVGGNSYTVNIDAGHADAVEVGKVFEGYATRHGGGARTAYLERYQQTAYEMAAD